jgi:hypothetical protein
MPSATGDLEVALGFEKKYTFLFDACKPDPVNLRSERIPVDIVSRFE